jgi:FKBP-type peptidyl-prolyl cis-trans isomerase
MFKKSHLLIGSALVLASQSYVLHAEDAVAAPAAATEPVAVQLPAAPFVAVPESELIEMLGYLTAQGGGVASLQLDAAGIAALADGVQKGLAGELDIQDFPQEAVQAAFGQAQARAEAVQAEAAELPAMTPDALQKIGLVMVLQSGLEQLGFGAAEADLIAKGFTAGALATEMDPSLEAKMPAFQAFIEPRAQSAQAAAQAAQAAAQATAESAGAETAAVNIAAGQAFVEGLDADVQSSESGLHYQVLETGSDPKPAMTDSVLVHYKGTLIDGTQFDSSYDRGTPATFPLNGVVKGFGEGLTKIGAGGKVILYIPSDLGYGNTPRPGGAIKPGDTLIFECELIEINPGS